MRIKFSLKQIFGLALVGSVIWGVLFAAYLGQPWALGASLVFWLFLVMAAISLVFTWALDRLAFLVHRRRGS
jgi:hypothetical protein